MGTNQRLARRHADQETDLIGRSNTISTMEHWSIAFDSRQSRHAVIRGENSY
jgi:hypothetical protein